jgi:hypothetical protein
MIYGAMANKGESSRFEIVLGAITASQIDFAAQSNSIHCIRIIP